MKTPQELAQQAQQLRKDLAAAYTPDMALMRKGDHAENLRLGMMHSLFDEIFHELSRKTFEFEYARKLTEEYMRDRPGCMK